ncbi:NAD(P)-binding protein [Exidia glandulosa HHB12029]|uniref:NAD(P)-binding protein n=1 Tax=Exidia glandulosa HHB12029 TaxID=1314781 RepID=A0A165PBX5_EXIGL|nr:NAD(P)-binding protein [Exidia glandulosa HHB12029]
MQTVLSKVKPHSHRAGATAIVTGATGILGREIVTALAADTQKWGTIHALSRSKKDECPANVVHNHIDLTAGAEEMAKQLKDVDGEYVFFAAYLQQDSEEESTRVNGDMLDNFLKALLINGTASKLKRIILVTGAKQYGVHLGRPKNPMHESDPWLPEPPNPPNFYYRQQRILHEFCAKHGIEWVVTYPNDVVGFARGNFMNLAAGIALYAAVHAELGRGELPWPGGDTFYTRFDSFTSSKLHAQFCDWAATAPGAANQAFNVVNGDVESWSNMWPKLAARFNLRVPANQFALPPEPSMSSVTLLADNPPVALVAAEAGLAKPQQSKVEARVDLVKWSQRPEIKEAWNALAQRESLEHDAFEKATWAFTNFVLGRDFDLIISMSKARKAGWTGYEDTWESFECVMNELEFAKIIPKTRAR